MFKSRKGYDKCLKYLVSKNFKDFHIQEKQHFGVPNINYSELLPKEEYNPYKDPYVKAKSLWNII